MKSKTDLFWNARDASNLPDEDVNITDIYQRELEFIEIDKFLKGNMKVLEVGCGNGFSTARFRERVKHIDSFDFSPEMIKRAKVTYGETNNKFYNDNVLDLKNTKGEYDLVICCRVLINLHNFEEQKQAIKNISQHIKTGGKLLLVEGFKDGFAELSEARKQIGLSRLKPASISCYPKFDVFIRFLLNNGYDITKIQKPHLFNFAQYDYLTRVIYPAMVGEENVKHNSEFCKRAFEIVKNTNNIIVSGKFSRTYGVFLTKM